MPELSSLSFFVWHLISRVLIFSNCLPMYITKSRNLKIGPKPRGISEYKWLVYCCLSKCGCGCVIEALCWVGYVK